MFCKDPVPRRPDPLRSPNPNTRTELGTDGSSFARIWRRSATLSFLATGQSAGFIRRARPVHCAPPPCTRQNFRWLLCARQDDFHRPHFFFIAELAVHFHALLGGAYDLQRIAHFG